MMVEIRTILWREWVFFKRRFWKILTALIVTPILYLIAFGWGLGGDLSVDGYSYMQFILPGIIALTSMRSSYSSISMRVSVARLHERSFENYLISPTRLTYLTLGHVLAGALRGMFAVVVLLFSSLIFGEFIRINVVFILLCFLNCLMFAALGFLASMVIDTHYDLNRFSSFVITPMAFLCGTFFSLKKVPIFLRWIIELLPLTHSTRLLRAIAFGGKVEGFSILVMLLYCTIFIVLSVKTCYEEIL